MCVAASVRVFGGSVQNIIVDFELWSSILYIQFLGW